jgi:membrane protease YdiL (CAAX protease family)
MKDAAATVSPRVDACAVLFALVLPTLVTLVYFVLLADYATGIGRAAYSVGKFVQFAFPVVWVLAVQRRRLRLQLPGRRGLAEGIGFGVFVLAAMLVLYHAWLSPAGLLDAAAVEVRDVLTRFGMDTPMKYVALGVFISLLHSLLEEYYWRWFVFGELRRMVSLWPAVLISSLGFMAHHVLILGRYFGQFSVTTILFSLAVAVGGAVWAWIYHRSDSLYGPWLSHLLVDAGLFLIGYQMLGGRFGP